MVTPPDWAALAVQNSDSPPQVTDPAGQDNAHAHGTAQARENSAASANDNSAATASDNTAVTGAESAGFAVNLEVFSGPFDLLLSLISKHRLDITEVALAQVTDEFIAFVADRDWPLEESSEFLVIAATLLDLKAARLLPAGEIEDPEDLARLEARDLLFARLLQYRAFREVADQFHEQFENLRGWYPRGVALEPWVAKLLPELVWSVEPETFAQIAAQALSRKPAPTEVDLAHLHAPKVSVRAEAANLVNTLRHRRAMTFRDLTGDATGLDVIVARFLALLELFRQSVVSFDQVAPLGDLTVRWTGTEEGEVTVQPDAELESDL
ncbi:MAG TPA: ScpA family protein [Actinomycetales bacterium]|nr:ScpA family protein [Actinomycetales bacterium]